MRSLLARPTLFPTAAAIGVLLVLTFALASFLPGLTHGHGDSQAGTMPESSPPTPAKVIHNPYTEWFLVWQKQSYTHTLVMARTKSQSDSWVDDELADLTDLQRAIYVVDDPTAPLHPPANKGNEAMAYLTYMIDFYDELPDVSTFMHYHSTAWHNTELLNRSSSTLLRRLSLEKVVREGYVNLRCDLVPGCPISAQLDRLGDGDTPSRMNEVMAATLPALFPDMAIPTTFAEPCCAQFAVSRAAIHRHPKSFYNHLRDWLLATDFPHSVSGRIFEYIWHWLFLPQAVFCPSEQLCFCDAYAICFPTAEAWLQYTGILKAKEAFLDEERDLQQQLLDQKQSAEPQPDETSRLRDLRTLIDGLTAEAATRRDEAFAIGADEFHRQRVLHDAWETLKMRGEL